MGPIRSEQMCSRCRNHGKNSILKGHKQLCPFLLCACKKCNDTKMRQKCIASEIAIHRRHLKLTNNSESLNLVPKFRSEKFESKYSIESVEHRRSQMCARCKNHGIDQPLRGHKNECKFADCQCEICEITAERRKIMAKQIREYRQTKLADGPDSTKEPNFDEVSLSSNESLRITPVNSQVYKPIPHFFDKFYMVQTLYDKFLQENTIKQIQLLYALVNLANDDCNVLEKALQEGKKLCLKILKSFKFMLTSKVRTKSVNLIN